MVNPAIVADAMKCLYLGMLIYLIALIACSITPKEEAVEQRILIVPSEALAKKSGTPLKELHIGFGVWMRQCGKCHEHVFPEDISTGTWHATTPRMAWNANITDKEQAALLKYILAVKGDSPEFGKYLETWAEKAR